MKQLMSEQEKVSNTASLLCSISNLFKKRRVEVFWCQVFARASDFLQCHLLSRQPLQTMEKWQFIFTLWHFQGSNKQDTAF